MSISLGDHEKRIKELETIVESQAKAISALVEMVEMSNKAIHDSFTAHGYDVFPNDFAERMTKIRKIISD